MHSPERSPRDSLLDIDDTKAIFRNKFPRAKADMEAQLKDFLHEFSEANKQLSDSNVNFGIHQVLEFTRELLENSEQDLLKKETFIVFSENVLHTVNEVIIFSLVSKHQHYAVSSISRALSSLQSTMSYKFTYELHCHV